MAAKMILASASPHRANLLRNAGLTFDVVPADIDERHAEAPLAGTGAAPQDIALVLAQAKAVDVGERHRDAYVIGCDQILSLDDEILHKVSDMEAARRRLLHLSGKTHQLSSAAVIVHAGEVVWQHVGIANMTMRTLSPGFVGRHLSAAGDGVIGSVGAYQIERRGIQLFESIDGDFFTVVGIPLLALLAGLRQHGLLDG